jgi:hypothetical protein
LDNCGKNIDLEKYFIQIKADLVKLQFQVNEFASSLVPTTNCDSKPPCTIASPQRNYKDCTCFCPVKCNSTDDQVFIRPKCECQFLANYSDIIAKRKECQNLITELSQVLRETETVIKYRQELMDEVTKYSRFISECENQWNKTSLAVKEAKILELFSYTETIIIKCKNFIGTGPCGKPCPRSNVIFVKDCTCYTTTQIKLFFSKWNSFLATESSIINYNFKNRTEDDAYWTGRSKEVRELAVKFYAAVTENKLTTQEETDIVTEFTAVCDKLIADWKAYLDSFKTAPTPKCAITCSGDTVKNCALCQCSPVNGFNDLNTRVADGIAQLLADIETLDALDESQKKILRNNANSIKNGRESLNSYTVEYCSNLDESFTQLRCLELIGWYDKLAADIKLIKGQQSTKVCNLACPNSIWKYDPNACTCDCSVSGCLSGIEVFDPYNCLCAKKTSCTKAQSDCDATNQLLDYSKCECKAKPVKK